MDGESVHNSSFGPAPLCWRDVEGDAAACQGPADIRSKDEGGGTSTHTQAKRIVAMMAMTFRRLAAEGARIRPLLSSRLLGASLGSSSAPVSQTEGLVHRPFSTNQCHETFGLTEMQAEFREMARSFAMNELAPHSAEWDETKHFPVDTLKKAAELGFGGIYCNEEHGGSGLGREDAAVIFEALAYGDISFTAYLTIHNMNCFVLDKFGSEDQKQRYLQRMTTMELLSSYCLTEPNSGSDAAALQTTATRREGERAYALRATQTRATRTSTPR